MSIPLKLVRLSDGKIFDIWKIIHGLEGEVSVWCNDWYGRHVIGQDCGFIQNDDCECNSEYKTGQTSVMCCNVCGKPDEDFWRIK